MFTSVLSVFGDVLAPRPTKRKEIWAFLKGGQYDKALVALREQNHGFILTEKDSKTGLTALHYAAAAGKLDLIIELIVQGAEVNAVDEAGNSILHFATQNDQRSAVEVLLRYGALPNIMNKAGLYAVEMTKNPAVTELFQRDKHNIFSPVVVTRPAPSIENDPELMSAKILGTDLLEDLNEAMGRVHVGGDNKEEYTIVGVTSATKKKQQQRSLVQSNLFPILDTSRDEDHEDHDHDDQDAAAGSESNQTPPSSSCSPITTTAMTTLPPPPPPVTPPHHSTLRHNATASTATNANANANAVPRSVNHLHPSGLFSPESFHQYYSSHIPTNTVAPHATAIASGPHATSLYDLSQARLLEAAQETAEVYSLTTEEFEARRQIVRYCQKFNEKAITQYLTYDPSLPMARLADMGALAVDGQTPLHVAARFNNLEALQLFSKLGQKVSYWVIDLQGRTPLHVAAEYQHDGVCAYLKAQMKAEMVAYHEAHNGGDKRLAEAQAHSPVGVFAPVDLGGNTPLGCAKLSAKGKPKREIEEVLFERGDRSVLPITPHEWRTGKSPWSKHIPAIPSSATSSYYGSVAQTPYLTSATPYTPHYTPYTPHTPGVMAMTPYTPAPQGASQAGLLYAYSEAQGWTVRMEDRTVIHCPLAGRPAWSLFMVCDGHGGAFVSHYLAAHLPGLLAELATTSDGGSSPPDDLDTTPEYLTSLLEQTCLRADALLQDHPRLKVSRLVGSGQLVCRDSSGSTALLLLVTTHYLAIANVGDSRAVLAKRQTGNNTTNNTGSNTTTNTISTTGNGNGTNSDTNTITNDNTITNTNNNTGNKRPSISRVTPGLQAVALSRDHKGRIPEERTRVLAAGAQMERVSGEADEAENAVHEIFTDLYVGRLRMTRSFGDFYLKQAAGRGPEEQAVTALPEVRIHARQSSDAFVVLACDGVWDVMSNEQVVDFLGTSLGYTVYGGPVGGITPAALATACDNLLAECLARGSHDNMSAIVLTLSPPTNTTSTTTTTSNTTSNNPDDTPSYPTNGTNGNGINGNGTSGRRRSFRSPAPALAPADDEIDVLRAFATPPDSCSPKPSSRPLYNLLEDDAEDDVQSPLNTKPGSHKLPQPHNSNGNGNDSVRKQLHFQ